MMLVSELEKKPDKTIRASSMIDKVKVEMVSNGDYLKSIKSSESWLRL